jgi:hypothetical protein
MRGTNCCWLGTLLSPGLLGKTGNGTVEIQATTNPVALVSTISFRYITRIEEEECEPKTHGDVQSQQLSHEWCDNMASVSFSYSST